MTIAQNPSTIIISAPTTNALTIGDVLTYTTGAFVVLPAAPTTFGVIGESTDGTAGGRVDGVDDGIYVVDGFKVIEGIAVVIEEINGASVLFGDIVVVEGTNVVEG